MTMAPKPQTWFILLTMVAIFLLSCRNTLNPDPQPLPEWEDKSADSATLTVSVQTQDGTFMAGAYVSLALSADSLEKNLWVRRSATDGAGRVRFSRLYPRIYYSNCSAYYNGMTYIGSFHITMPPQAVKDTLLFVH